AGSRPCSKGRRPGSSTSSRGATRGRPGPSSPGSRRARKHRKERHDSTCCDRSAGQAPIPGCADHSRYDRHPVFLKSLTLKGFKSFADKTTLEFEPGIAVVVGPNGSGKSNLVDAVAWVLGAQGPRTVRGGKMDDVIFAGTPQRPSLGR